jgi:hypothetical protein
MKRKRINRSQNFTLLQGGDGEGESGSVFTTYGPVKAGLTTSQRTQVQALSESLSCLERKTQDLESRFYEVCVTLNLVMGVLVERKLIGTNAFTIDKEEESE